MNNTRVESLIAICRSSSENVQRIEYAIGYLEKQQADGALDGRTMTRLSDYRQALELYAEELGITVVHLSYMTPHGDLLFNNYYSLVTAIERLPVEFDEYGYTVLSGVGYPPGTHLTIADI